ncbi:hypothetical protein ACVWWW_000736 [Lysobacter sp. HA18]
MMRSTFSITTIASSTTMPIASTMPNSESWLMVKPRIFMPRNVPSSATGMTSVGISVARMFCRNSSITRKTSTIASSSVCTTSSTDTCTKSELSYGENHCTPFGKLGCNSSMRFLTAAATASAFSPGPSCTAKPAAGWPSHFRSKLCAEPVTSTRATSRRRTLAPFGSARSRMFSNSCGVEKRPSAATVAVNICDAGDGSPPTWPAENCTFCARTAASTSLADRP